MSITKRILALKQAGKGIAQYDPWFDYVQTWVPGTGEPMQQIITLDDNAPTSRRTLPITINHAHGFLEIMPQGYGEHGSENGAGAPVIIELYDGHLRLIVSPDINSPNKTIIDLETAREDAREKDPQGS